MCNVKDQHIYSRFAWLTGRSSCALCSGVASESCAFGTGLGVTRNISRFSELDGARLVIGDLSTLGTQVGVRALIAMGFGGGWGRWVPGRLRRLEVQSFCMALWPVFNGEAFSFEASLFDVFLRAIAPTASSVGNRWQQSHESWLWYSAILKECTNSARAQSTGPHVLVTY